MDEVEAAINEIRQKLEVLVEKKRVLKARLKHKKQERDKLKLVIKKLKCIEYGSTNPVPTMRVERNVK